MSPPVEQLLIQLDATIREALALIDLNALGVAFVVDGDGRLLGVSTDGDIRRALLNGVVVDEPICKAMQRNFQSASVDSPRESVVSRLNSRIRVLPLLDFEGRPVDYASLGRSHALPVMEPSLDGNELDYLVECVTTGWISSQGPFVRRFEAKFAEYLGVPEAIAVSNGTVALHLALVALNIGPGDEVIVPDLTFAASINAILYCGATPVIADVGRETWTLDPDQLSRLITARTKAIMPVHLYGQSADMAAIMEVAKARGLLVVEDAAEALGTEFDGKMVGSIGDAGTFSFFGNKLITTGEGGMIVFRDPAIAARARRLRDHGMDPSRRYWHQEVGYNYRLTNMQAAIGTAQLERIGTFVARKRELARSYQARLGAIPGLYFQLELSRTDSVCWLFSLRLDPGEIGLTRDELADRLKLNGIETRPVFFPLHVMPPYESFGKGRLFPNAALISANGLSLPSAVTLSPAEIDHVCGAIEQVLSTARVRRLAVA